MIEEAGCRLKELESEARAARTDFCPLEVFSRNSGFRDALISHLSPVDVIRLGACSRSLRETWHDQTEGPPVAHVYCTTHVKDRQIFLDGSKAGGMMIQIPSGNVVEAPSPTPCLNDSLAFLKVVFPLNTPHTVKSVASVSGPASGAFVIKIRLRGSHLDSLLLFAPTGRPARHPPPSIWRAGGGASARLTHGVGYVDPANPAYFWDSNHVIIDNLMPAVSPQGRIFAFRGMFCEDGFKNDSNYRETAFYCPVALRFEVAREVKHAYPLLVPGVAFGQVILGGLGGHDDFFTREIRELYTFSTKISGAKRIIFTNSLLIHDSGLAALGGGSGATVFKRGRLYWLTDFETFNFPLPTIPLSFSSDLGTEALVYDNKSGYLMAVGGINRLSGRKRSEIFGLNLRKICSCIQSACGMCGSSTSSLNSSLQALWCQKIQEAMQAGSSERLLRQIYERGPCCVGPTWQFLGLLQNPRSDGVAFVSNSKGVGGRSLIFLVGGRGKSTQSTPLFECLDLFFSDASGLRISQVKSSKAIPAIKPWKSCQVWA